MWLVAPVNFIPLRTETTKAPYKLKTPSDVYLIIYVNILGSAATASLQVLELQLPRLPLPNSDPSHAHLLLPDPGLGASDLLPGASGLGGGVQRGRDPQDAPETLPPGHPHSGSSAQTECKLSLKRYSRGDS